MANLECSLKVSENTPFAQLATYIGDNIKLQNIIFTKLTNGDKFVDSFVKWYQEKHNTKEIPSIEVDNESLAKKLAKDIYEYYETTKTSVSNTSRMDINDDNTKRFGYTSTLERENGKKHTGTLLLEGFKNVINNGTDVGENPLKYYIPRLRNSWRDYINAYIAKNTGKSVEQIEEEYIALAKEDISKGTAYYDEWLGGENKSAAAKNLFAVYKELYTSNETVVNYINELIANKNLNPILGEIKDAVEVEVKKYVDYEGENVADTNDFDTDEMDARNIMSQYDHSGMFSSFMMHVGPRITLYFNTLRKHKSATIKDYDTNNTYGIAETMDAQACVSMLYNSAIFDNIDSMIKGVKKIADTIPGFEAFVQFAKDLEEDLDFATEVRTVFAKTKVQRIETKSENDIVNTDISNPRCSPRTAMTFNLHNNAKSTISDMVSEDVQAILSSVESKYESINIALNNLKRTSDPSVIQNSNNTIAKYYDSMVTDVVRIIRGYFPSIQESAIKAFISINRKANGETEGKVKNVGEIISIIDNLIEARDKSAGRLANMQAKAEEIKTFNDELKQREKDGEIIKESEFKSYVGVYSDDFIQPYYSVVGDVVNMFLSYSVIDTDLNAKTIKGKNQSSIINNSYLTGLIKMLEDVYVENVNGVRRTRCPKLEAWGLEKLKSTQYKYSNILIEQIDPDTNEILNKDSALFKYVDGQLCLTEYADQVLKFYQFSGSANMDNGTNLALPDMVMGDFFPTAYANFFNSVNKDLIQVPSALYFLSTPSDAPNIFAIRAPRHETAGILKIKNEEQFNADVEELSRINAKIITGEEAKKRNYFNRDNNGNVIFDNNKNANVHKLLTERNNILVYNREAIKPISEPDVDGSYDAYVTFVPQDGLGLIVVMKGRIEKANKADILNNAEIEATLTQPVSQNEYGVKHNSEVVLGVLKGYYREELLKGDITIGDKTYAKAKYIIDTNHKVYKMFKNQFRQELCDAAQAIDTYFELVPDKDAKSNPIPNRFVVYLENDKPVFKNPNGNNEGYENYHLGKNGKVLEIDKKNKTYKLDGKVFHSTKFTLTKMINGVATPINYLDRLISHKTIENDNRMINFLYGGATFIYDENGDIDVLLSNEQNAAIDENLSEFLIDYISQVKEDVDNYSNFIKRDKNGISHNDINDVANYALNEYLTRFSYDELLIGNTKFYKSTQDVLKRVKECQGSGVPYGTSDYSAGFTPDADTLTSNSYLNEGEITEYEKEIVRDTKTGKRIRRIKRDAKGNKITKKVSIIEVLERDPALKGIKQTNGFRAVIIKNSKRTNVKALTELQNKLTKIGVNPELAVELMWGSMEKDDDGNIIYKNGEPVRKGGYTETKVNDAQSYITYKEWVRRIAARGQLKKYLPLIQKLADPKSKLTGNDIKEFVQLQKNFYYDMYYDKKYKMFVPRQIKNAEFVLVPRLIEGTQLEDVAKLMEKAGIDQLNTRETSKAANSEILTLWDNEGNISQERLDNFAYEAINARQTFSYNYLYTQQETPQHMNATNKFGIQIAKKIMDNLPDDDSYLGKLKKEYFRLAGTNVEESFIKLLNELDVPRDENREFKIDKNGNIEGINMEVFYNKLKDELIRTGMDNNAKDYVTIPVGSSVPLMPAFTNNYLPKFESIVQSMFNNAITRQRLPGFHAGQVTQIGWRAATNELLFKVNDKGIAAKVKEEITLDEYHNLSEKEKTYYDKVKGNLRSSKDLAYHPNGESYIEVMVPYSVLGIDKNSDHYKNMTDEEILAELAVEDSLGLDNLIGYRIPTEGKQSVAHMKIVGFISSAYGSTIVVPDDWVSQTGSDFDIDSVYGIQFETYKTTDGQIKKVKYKNNFNIYDWFSYINLFANETVQDRFSKGSVAKGIKAIKNLQQEQYIKLNNIQSEEFDKLSKEEKDLIKEIDAAVDKEIKKLKINAKSSRALQLRLQRKIEKLSVSDSAELKNHANTLKVIKSIIDNQVDGYSDISKKYIDKQLEDHIKEYNKIAKDAGLLTSDEFFKAENIEKANGQKARNSRLLEVMIEVLSNDACLEENLSRSNFDKVVDARNDNMDKNMNIERNNRNPYNPVDQFRYQQEAMSGATLKAFSVTLDTFCSVCNTVKPTLSSPIYVVYDGKKYNDKEFRHRFGNTVTRANGTFSVMHDKYGWSNDNRNAEGYLLTSYSSQTTAYILDNIKEGSIPNLNNYTFSVFKTIVNCGCDFDTAVSFIMQPGVTEIINAYNSNNSVFGISSGNPIHTAIDIIAKKLNVDVKDRAPVTAKLAAINKKYGKKFNDIFKQEGTDDITIGLKDKDLVNLPIIVDKLINRLKKSGEFSNSSPVEQSLFDLGVILTFHKLSKTANEIGDIARCCNPDKFGAKQSVHATRDVFDRIDKCIFNREEDFETGRFTNKLRKEGALKVGDKHILESIYPGIGDHAGSVDEIINYVATQMNYQDSSYKTLAAFLKYSSAISAVIARQVFPTQNENFVSLINGFRSVLSNYNPELSEETYSDVQRYVLSSFYTDAPAIKYPVKVRKVNGKIVLTHDTNINVNDPLDEDRVLADRERNRIYGYDHVAGTNVVKYIKTTDKDGKPTVIRKVEKVTVKDINNPTEDELKLFERLSPAQKVHFIQQNVDEPGIFDLIEATLVNGYKRGPKAGMQTLEYRENINSNTIYSLFKEAFFNDNPLFVSAAIDIVKYGMQVEGFKMTARAVNKVIDNSCLINDFGKDGLGFISYINNQMSDIFARKGKYNTREAIDLLYENYLRSHPNTKGVKTLYLSKKNIDKYKLDKLPYGTYFLKRENTGDEFDDIKKFDKLLEEMGVKYHLPITDTYNTNSYIQLKQGKKTTLYRINDLGNYVILTPLNKLELFENNEWSCNEENNRYPSREFYDYLISNYVKEADKVNWEFAYLSEKYKEYKEINKRAYYTNRTLDNSKIPADKFDINKLAKEFVAIETARNKIVEHFKGLPKTESLFLNVGKFYDYIHTPGFEYGSTQKIKIGPKDTREFQIFIPKNIRKFEKAILSRDFEGNYPNARQENVPQELIKIIEAHQGYYSKFTGLVQVVPIDQKVNIDETDSMAQSHEEMNAEVMDFAVGLTKGMVSVHGNETDTAGDISSRLSQSLRNEGIGFDLESIGSKLDVSTREIAKYCKNMADYIETQCYRRFVKDPDTPNTYLKITDDKVLSMIQDDAKFAESYMAAYNIMDGFLQRFEPYRNYKSEDPTTQRYIEDIQGNYKRIVELPISQVLNNGIEAICKPLSNNPLIRQGLVDVLSGFWKTYGHMWQYNDIQENGTPVLQIMLKSVMTDIDAKAKNFRKIKAKFWKDLNAIIKEAEEKGEPIDIQKLVDKDGRFIKDYVGEFVNDLNELKNAVTNASLKYGQGSVEHLEAKLKYDVFKAKYLHQQAKPEYYIKKATLEANIIREHPVVYSAYMKLFYERCDLYNYASKAGFTDESKKRLHDIEFLMYNLYNPASFIVDGEAKDRPSRDPSATYSKQQEEILNLYGDGEANALNNFLKEMKDLNSEYFKYDAVYNFDEELRANLEIVRSFENVYGNQVASIPQNILENNPDYIYAKNWIRKNAKFTLNVVDAAGQPTTVGAKLKAALTTLGKGSNGKNAYANSMFKDYNNGESIYDEFGTPDGRKLSEEDRAKLKENTEINWKSKGYPLMSDRILISNARPNNDVYKKSFYEHMRRDGKLTDDYIELVTKLNKYLEKYYVEEAGIIDFSLIKDTEEGIEELNTIADLYFQLSQCSKYSENVEDEERSQWIKDNVEFHTNEETFKAQFVATRTNSGAYKEAISKVLCARKKDGSIHYDHNGKPIPNSFIYGYITPKGEPGTDIYDDWIDKERNEAIKLVEKAYIKTPTKYYVQAKNEALARAQEHPNEFNFMNDWYLKNHVYNPYTRKMEPLSCWVESKLDTTPFDDNSIEGKWEPKSTQRQKVVIGTPEYVTINGMQINKATVDMRDPEYDPNKSLADNYRKGSDGGKYDSKVVLTESDRKMINYLQNILINTANVQSARRFFRDGYLPMTTKAKETDTKMVAQEVLKMFGIGIAQNNGKDVWYDDIDFASDRTPLMPMTKILHSKNTADIEAKLKELEETKPTKEKFPDDNTFNSELDVYNARKKELEDQLRIERQSLLNRDWYNVIECYLEQANRYNAILDNKNKLYFLLSSLKQLKMYSRKYGAYGDLKKNDKRSGENTVYSQTVDTKLIEQLETWMQRLLFDQWKEPEGTWTAFANALQGFTSANYMMLNMRGGVANVTLGETAILAEAAAAEVMNVNDWRFGTQEWTTGSIGFARGGFEAMFSNKGTSFNKQDAIIKYMNVVDYDENTGVVRELNLEEYSKKIRDFMFSPQTIGEHFMQNSVLFAMMHSHKVVYDEKGKAHIMNKGEYIALREEQTLKELLTIDLYEKFEKFKEDIKSDANKLSKYTWFRREALTDFIYLHCDNNIRKEFEKRRKDKHKEFEKEFKEKQDIYSQCELGSDGKMAFTADSDLFKLDIKKANILGEVNQADYLLAEFAERVRKVNNRIHGVYNRMGAATIEKKWYGSLVMQYHKHLPIGILKRYMARGHWNETRGSVSKGMIQSIADIANLNYRKIRVEAGLSEEQENALKAWTYSLTHIHAYLNQLKETIAICPVYDRANAMRNLGDAIGVLGAMATVAALWYLADHDKDIQDSLMFNFWLYEADRLATEAFMYNPLGLANETKKLMSTPIAAQSIITDALSTTKALIDWTLDDEYDPYYHSGRFAGESKLSVYVQRRIPMWNGIRNIFDMADNNHYYKLGENPIGLFNVKEKVTGKKD